MSARWAAVCVAALAAACAKPAAAPPAPVAQVAAHSAVVLTAAGMHFSATWRFLAPRVGEIFAVDVDLADVAGQPLAAAAVTLAATMPAHGHGMMTDPEVRQTAAGHWHAEGFKLHMHGTWELAVEVTANGQKERLTAPWQQAPAAMD